MDKNLQIAIDLIKANKNLSAEEKAGIIINFEEAGRKRDIQPAETEDASQVIPNPGIVSESEENKKIIKFQKHELEVEAALEKVRSRSLAMHHSDDLREVVTVVFQTLQELNFALQHAAIICIYTEGSKDHVQWIADPGQSYAMPFNVPYHDNPMSTDIFNARESGQEFFSRLYPFEIKNEYFNFLFTNSDYRHLPDDVKMMILESRNFGFSFAFAKNSAILVPANNGTLLSINEANVLKRFANVFDQAYVRFLDLQKAEAQAGEAQIELGLERVRARAMAMQGSAELSNLIETVYAELTRLDVSLDRCFIMIFDSETLGATWWMADAVGAFTQKGLYLQYHEHPPHLAYLKAWQERREKWQYILEGKVKKDWDEYIFSETELRQLPEFVVANMKAVEKAYISASFSNFGGLIIASLQPITEESFDILLRFSTVFDSTYTRFNDLQKAEAQAREAQIELALEKVRARTMAMHQSSELAEAATLLFAQLSQLGASIWICGFCICKKDRQVVEKWVSPPDGKMMDPVYIPYTIDEFEQRAYEAWKTGQEIYSDIVEGTKLQESHEQLLEHPSMQKAKIYLVENNIPMPTWVQRYAVTYKHGYLMVVTLKQFEETQILVRFARVFEQTYTRFLDLIKAEAQAREAQIEVALERVRSRTMAMQRSEELANVATILFQQVKALGVPQWACGFGIFEIDDKEFTWYQGGADDNILPPVRIPLTEHPVFIQFNESRKRGDELYIHEKQGEVQDDHYRYMMTVPGLGEGLQSVLDAGFTFPTYQIDHVANFSHGNLLFITYEHFPEMHDVFKRFAKVFEQTYTRFLDLEKAEAQAREAQIELGLERIRARAMAMQKSDELAEAAKLLYDELRMLNISPVTCGYAFINEEQHTQTVWVTLPDGTLLPDYIVFPLTGDLILNDRYKGWKQKEPLHKAVLEGEVNKEHHRFLSSQVPANVSTEIFEHIPENIVFYSANFSAGYLMIIATESFSAEEEQMIIRFAKVFEITYTRFLDLQRAEAQVREAQIELALERVRARTMAMQKSDELDETNMLILRQLESLDISLVGIGIHICNSDTPESEAWMWDMLAGKIPKVTYNHTYDRLSTRIYEGWKKGETLYVEEVKGEKLKNHLEYVSSLLPDPTIYEDSIPALVFHIVYFTYGFFVLATPDHCPTEHPVFIRFAKVFEQTYTRFLDLQKAEAQAREAKIEYTLEKVRSRTMAMQKSDELAEVAAILFKQVNGLGIETWTTGFNVWSEDNNSWTDYVTNPEGGFIEPYIIDATEFPVFIEVSNAKKRGDEFYVQYVEGEMLKETYRQLSSFANKKQFEILLEEGFEFPSHQYHHFVFGSKVSLMFITYEPIPEAHDIFKRFGKVFEQTYTRFLDLQKAEAQAREAQIELSLERVRAKAMAMQKSDDLADAANLLFQQVQALGVPSWSCGFNIWEEKEKCFTAWMSSEGILQPPFKILLSEVSTFNRFYESRQKGEVFYVEEMGGDALVAQYEYMQGLPGFGEILDDFLKSGFTLPTFQINHVVNFTQGNLIFITSVPVPEAFDIFKRFAIVFEQTYTRFLDLQKAEAQAREAKIEAALEKVRSRSLAMHKSDELEDVAAVVFEKLQALNFSMSDGAAVIMTFIEGSKDHIQWIADPGQAYATSFKIPYSEHSLSSDIFNAKESGIDFFSKLYPFEEINPYFKYLFEHTDYSVLPDEVKQMLLQSKDYGISIALEKNSAIVIPTNSGKLLLEKEKEILKRFAKVFEQSYIRFLDLQKAEAQAREATIEAALEKIRSRSLAMHRSDELKDVIAIMLEKLNELDVLLGTVGIWLFNKATMDSIFWVGTNLQQPSMVSLPYDEQLIKEDTNYRDSWQAWINGEGYINKEYTFEQKNKYFNYVFANNDFDQIPASVREFIMQAPGHVASLIIEKNSSLFFDSWNGQFYSEASINILKRTAKVFEQAYIRFLDLQKAEAQAREAKIEAALERVRSRSMGMQKSAELKEVIQVVYEQFVHLNIHIEHTGFIMDYKVNNDMHIWLADRHEVPAEVTIPYFDCAHWNSFIEAKEKGKDFFANQLNFEEKNKFYRDLFKLIPGVPEETLDYYFSCAGLAISTVLMDNVGLYIENFSGIPYTEEENNILMRFGKVFQQTYTRFNDLQKAEAQAKEAKIEMALEKVRAQSMAMSKSEDLALVASTVFNELEKLEVKTLRCGIGIINEANRSVKAWITTSANVGNTIGVSGDEPLSGHPLLNNIFINWKAQKSFGYTLEGMDLIEYYKAVGNTGFQEDFAKEVLSNPDVKHFYYCVMFPSGGIFTFSETSFSEGTLHVLKRFADAFHHAYKRFEDLQKAEAQAREAQRQLALERIRGRSLAMHHSDELKEVVAILFQQLKILGLEFDGGAAIHLFSENSKDAIIIVAAPDLASPIQINLPYDKEAFVDNPIILDVWHAKETGEHIFNKLYSFEEKNKYFDYVIKHNSLEILPQSSRDFILQADSYTASFIAEKNSLLGANSWSRQVFSENDFDVLKRIAKVFEQAFIRFLDLQKAEAQAREAQIEAALERVRAKTMAMHKSEQLSETAKVFFEQFDLLGKIPDRMSIGIINEESKKVELWVTDQSGNQVNHEYFFSIDEPTSIAKIYKAWKESEETIVIDLTGTNLKDWLQFVKEEAKLPIDETKIKGRRVQQAAFFRQGFLLFTTHEPVADEIMRLLVRFARVFEQTYTRFLDLQKAEAQAREAQVEVSLERIRAKAMGMHSSGDLLSVTQVLREQMGVMGETKLESIIIHLYNNVTDDYEAWYSFRNPDDPYGKIVDGKVVLDWSNTARARMDKEMYQSAETEYTITADRNILAEWYNYLKIVVPEVVEEDDQGNIIVPDVLYYNYSKFDSGALLLITNSEASGHSKNLLRRSSKVFNLAYTRFLDLKKAEAQAREAIRQASLDRVRGQIASMRSTEDLQRITPLIWHELTALGVPFIRCGVFIIDESNAISHVYLSSPDGHSLAVLNLPFDSNELTTNAVDHWRKRTVYHQHWSKEEFITWTKSLMAQGQIQNEETFQGAASPPEKLDLHFIPFTQGMLYVGNIKALTQNEIDLVKALAEAFAIAYARYEDFNKLEKAKESIEVTLTELKATQSQLIQSEKMASLGELTAGIAHEIQNPLNFVNNFSEVSKELLEEMKEEMTKGNLENANEIMHDIIQNLEKINHHGKRADGIVKGMLQHSNTGSNNKEPTDINALADEYLRLAYHGLRAKDKSFNAITTTNFDKSLEKLNIIPQDIGRVVLNLITNAFYAVNERKQQLSEGYEPTVTVSSRKLGDIVELRVSDNGKGIPQTVLNKIFQPFFTTKPTGQGTGLGLSLSYDIIKAHGGEIKVETKECKGSEFIVLLPMDKNQNM